MVQSRVSIFGAGPTGFALAADLDSRGIKVLIYSHPQHLTHTTNAVRDGLLTVRGLIEASVAVTVTTDISAAVAFSNTLIFTVPSTAQATLYRLLKPFDLSQHALVAIPGNLFSLVTATQLHAKEIFETNIAPYSCRINAADGILIVSGKKERCTIASLRQPADRLTVARIARVLPLELRWAANVVEVSLTNINAVFHPPMVLMNAARIEHEPASFRFYADGLSRAVANAITAADRVRLQIGAELGFSLSPALEVSNDCYGQHFADLVDLAQNSPPHSTLMAPAHLDTRNITEDVADLLVCWHGLAETLGVDARPLLAIIVLAGMANGKDYLVDGRNLTRLGLQHLSREDLVARFGADKTLTAS